MRYSLETPPQAQGGPSPLAAELLSKTTANSPAQLSNATTNSSSGADSR